MSLHALSALQPTTATAAARLPGGTAAAAASATSIEHWLLADDGVGGALLQAGPRSQRLSIDAMERQFAAALVQGAADGLR